MQLPCSRAAREARADPWVCRLKEKDSYTVIFVLKIRGAHMINSSSGYLTCGTCGTCGMWGDPPDRGQGSSESGVDQTPAARAFSGASGADQTSAARAKSSIFQVSDVRIRHLPRVREVPFLYHIIGHTPRSHAGRCVTSGTWGQCAPSLTISYK